MAVYLAASSNRGAGLGFRRRFTPLMTRATLKLISKAAPPAAFDSSGSPTRNCWLQIVSQFHAAAERGLAASALARVAGGVFPVEVAAFAARISVLFLCGEAFTVPPRASLPLARRLGSRCIRPPGSRSLPSVAAPGPVVGFESLQKENLRFLRSSVVKFSACLLPPAPLPLTPPSLLPPPPPLPLAPRSPLPPPAPLPALPRTRLSPPRADHRCARPRA